MDLIKRSHKVTELCNCYKLYVELHNLGKIG